MSERKLKTMEIELPAGISPAKPQYVSDLIADLLGALGYQWVPLTAGASYRGLHDSIVNHRGNRAPQMLNCTHEEIAVALAHGYAKTSGKPGLVILHDLVGVMHGVMGLFDAWCDRVPLLMLGGSGPMDPKKRRPIEFVHTANTQGDLVRQVVKWHDEPTTPAAIIDAIIRGHRIANTPPYGPVYISVDEELQRQPVEGSLTLPDLSLARFAPPAPLWPAPAQIEAAAKRLWEARFPLVMGGNLSYRAAATGPLVELVETLGAAYIDNPNYISFPTNHQHNLSGDNTVLKQADAILMVDVHDIGAALGLYADEEGRRGSQWPADRTVIDLSVNDLAFDSWAYYGGETSPTDIRLLADPVVGLTQLLAAVKALKGAGTAARVSERTSEIVRRHNVLAERFRQEANQRAQAGQLTTTHLVDLVWEAVRGRSCVLSGRNLQGWPQGVWDVKAVGDYVSTSGGGGVGYGPGGALGSALAAHERGQFPVAIIGDGDMVMAAGALWTAAHYRIPMLAVIGNNRSFGNDEAHQRRVARMRERPVENAWIGVAMFDPEIDYATIARGFGAWGRGPVTSVSECRLALREAVAEVERGGVAVVDVRTMR